MSIRKNDPGYHKRAAHYNVFLNGNELTYCYTADEDRGFAIVHKIDKNGKPLLNENRTEIITEKKFGKIEIVRIKNA